MKAMLSQPMAGKMDEEIIATREKAIKALLSTTVSDGMYYELTYNGDKKELYFDAYKKWQNICFEVKE